jgi:4-hydroxybutyryl-CoA dehydratase/vinylacetyl-CoA-Delta-isomerase
MALRKAEQYVTDLKKLQKEIYMFGEKLDDWTEHPIIKASINAQKVGFELAQLEEFQDVMTMESTLIGEKVNRYVQLHTSIDDLIKRLFLNFEVQPRIGSCHGTRCSGTHVINVLYAVTYDMDKSLGTDYHERFKRWLQKIQSGDLTCTLAATDVGGDRSKRVSEQIDPDLYTHIVERKKDGIVIRGAKMYMSASPAAEWHVIMSPGAYKENEKDYSIACAIPADSKGVIYIHEWPAVNAARIQEGADIDLGVSTYGVHSSALIILDDVFVPYEHVFLCGEVQFGRQIGSLTGRIQRPAATACKVGTLDVMAGAAALAAEANGLNWKKVPHIRDKVTRIATLAAQCKGCVVGASAMAEKHPSGIFIPDLITANSAKLLEAEASIEASKLLIDVAGGLTGAAPSERDLKNPKTRKYLEKYLTANPDVSVEDRMRTMRLCEYLCGVSSTLQVQAIHTGVSPEGQKMTIANAIDMDKLKSYAKKLANIQD